MLHVQMQNNRLNLQPDTEFFTSRLHIYFDFKQIINNLLF